EFNLMDPCGQQNFTKGVCATHEPLRYNGFAQPAVALRLAQSDPEQSRRIVVTEGLAGFHRSASAISGDSRWQLNSRTRRRSWATSSAWERNADTSASAATSTNAADRVLSARCMRASIICRANTVS